MDKMGYMEGQNEAQKGSGMCKEEERQERTNCKA